MNRRMTGLAIRVTLAMLVALAPVVAHGTQDDHGEAKAHDAHDGEMTLRGEILDMACYVAHEAKGPDHAACAKRCVKGGQPMGLLADDGTVYLLYANHEDGSAFEATKEHAGETVEITGVAATQGGIRGLEVTSVKPI